MLVGVLAVLGGLDHSSGPSAEVSTSVSVGAVSDSSTEESPCFVGEFSSGLLTSVGGRRVFCVVSSDWGLSVV